jgi:hypothetical protein
MISCCGLDCAKCEAFIATQENDNAKRAEVASKWSAQYHSVIKPEQVNCTGCRSDGVKFDFAEHVCEIRKCNIEMKTPHCAACSMYKCEKLEKFIQMAPPIGTALESLRRNSTDQGQMR